MAKVINSIKIDETLTLMECSDGFWLYDTTRGMNIAMHTKSKDDAFIEAIKYYQKRLLKVESDCKLLKNKVEKFVESFINTNEDYTLTLWDLSV